MQQKSLEHTVYHSVLRIALCVFALLLVFDSGLVSEKSVLLSRGAQDYVASAVGVKVGVPANDVNVLTARITELEQELAARDREISVSLSGRDDGSSTPAVDMSTFILSIILFILLVLIVMNYILDYLRSRPVRKREVMVS